ncbi:hypothetical protein ATANTOWER_011291 [Ataeniobius toweri]|uniref:Secreted protein n=1 Tax=Ataeniobius toweri TaxID=208326 RepID=A0ABU7A634_9TELE|nr:hypothetical protein [Ataeniobius toweri]
MLPALRRLSVLPLRFSFGHSSSSFEEPTCLRLFMPRYSVKLRWQQPDTITSASSERTLSNLQRAAPLDSI